MVERQGDGPELAVELRQVSKRFGSTLANDAVDLAVRKGTIHGIIGENGAGKSTLMNVLYGFYKADGGTMRIEGQEARIRRPEDAIAAGISMVHQHFMLIEPFTVLENLLLGAEGGRTLRRGAAKARGEIARIERDYGLEVSLDARVEDLPVGLQQRVEILKALHRGARTLILDEPTGVLTPQEAEHLFRILANLKAQGRTVILITHKLREIMAITDEVSVMRGGRMVAHRQTAQTSREELAELMIGRKVAFRAHKEEAVHGPTVLKVEDLSLRDEDGVERLGQVSFEVQAGEILGVAGVSGNGQSELLEVLSGMRPASAGRVLVNGQAVRGAAEARRHKVAHVPEDRLRSGLVKGMPARENAVLGYHRLKAYGAGAWLSRQALTAVTQRWLERYDVRPRNAELDATAFSGGNQQKLVMAREIEHDPALLLVGQPTRGVDIGAIEFIHRRLIELRNQGKAILLVSVELDEILALADRIIVMSGGRITGTMPARGASERAIGLMMAGIEQEAA